VNQVRVEIIATGKGFESPGVRSFETVIKELFQSAQIEVQVAIYLISPSAIDLVQFLGDRASRGIRVTIILNSLKETCSSVRQILLNFSRTLGDLFRVYSFKERFGTDLHAKVVVVDRKKAIIGSSNFSWGGMVENHEMGVMVEGYPAWQIATLLDNLVDELSSA